MGISRCPHCNLLRTRDEAALPACVSCKKLFRDPVVLEVVGVARVPAPASPSPAPVRRGGLHPAFVMPGPYEARAVVDSTLRELAAVVQS